MIYDKLENLDLYSCISEKMAMAINYITTTDFSNMNVGKYELLGKEVFVIVSEYNTKVASEVKWEAHKTYADIQFVIKGSEKMGFSSIDKMTKVTEPYNAEKDIEFYEGEGNYVDVNAGEVCFFFPHDVHRPSMEIGGSKPVKKVIVKVMV